jgi:hypothetical protein
LRYILIFLVEDIIAKNQDLIGILGRESDIRSLFTGGRTEGTAD